MPIQNTPVLSSSEWNQREQGRTIVQAATTANDTINVRALCPDVDTNEKLVVIFNCPVNYYINIHGDSGVPSGDDLTNDAPMLNPESVIIPGKFSTVSFATEVASYIHMEIFRYGH